MNEDRIQYETKDYWVKFKEKPEWFQRLCVERDELQQRLDKLRVYLSSSEVCLLRDGGYRLLKMQFHTMKTYLAILDMRIGRGSK